MSKDQEKKTNNKEKESPKKVESKKTEKSTKVVKKRQAQDRPIPAWAYCNIVGLSPGLRATVKKRFGSLGRKTTKQWKEIFTKEGLV